MMNERPREPELTVVCTPFSARLTERGCALNQRKAKTAMEMVSSGASVFLVDSTDLDRMMLCGTCPLAEGIDAASAAQCAARVLREIVRTWRETEEMDWWRGDPHMAMEREREKKKRWRAAHRQEIAEDKRYRALRKRLGVLDRKEEEE